MQYFPPALENLVEHFAKLPGIGKKTAQRLAFYLLSQPEEEAASFADAILGAKRSIACCPVCQNFTEGEGPCAICQSPKRNAGLVCVVADPKDVIAFERSREFACCPVCQNFTEGEGPCAICQSPKRNAGLVCVVADPKDVIAFERSREYDGLYHVLHGVISPMNHVGPDDLHIKSLVERVAGGHHGHQSGDRGGSHGHVPLPPFEALQRKGQPSGLRHPGGFPPGVC